VPGGGEEVQDGDQSVVETSVLALVNTVRATATSREGGPNLDYEWIPPEQSVHITRAILKDLKAGGFQIVKKA